MRLSKANLGILIAIGSAVLFGLSPVCTRAAYADGANAGYAVVALTVIRTLVLFFFCMATGKKLFATRADTTAAVKNGAFQAISSYTNIAALLFLPAPVAVTISYSHTLMLLFFMAWRGEAKLDTGTVVSTLIALLGLTFVVDVWSTEGHMSVVGILLALTAAVAMMSRMYGYDRQTKSRNPAVVGAESFLCTTAFILMAALLLHPQMPKTLIGHGWMLLSGLTAGVATFAMFYGISLIGSFKLSLFMKIEPVFVAIFAFLLIDEALYWHQYMGILLVIGSLGVYQYMQHGKKEAPPHEA